ncbi:MAG: helix-turn-helix transcriptional regulator [Candidatus Micrarchaeia archaeon]|jgi:putative transcriptional regulator
MKNNISGSRKRLGLTQEQLAEKCDVSRQTIIAIEQGRFNPSLPLAFAITRALKAKKIEDVFEG